MRRDTLLDFFESFSDSRKPFLLHDDGYATRAFSYRETAASARAFAARLQSLGCTAGDRVLFWSENRPEWIAAFWGCLLAGVVVVPVDYRASPALLERIARAAGAKLLLAGDEVPDPTGAALPTVLHFRDWDWHGRGVPAPVPVTRNHLAEILFTSGATAEPKGVLIEHRNILANIVPVEGEILKYRRWGRPFFPIRFLNLLPLSHLFGQAMSTFIPPVLEGVVVFLNGYAPARIVEQIRRRRVSVLVCVPKVLEVLREYVLHGAPEAALEPPEGSHWLARWWKYRHVHRLFGWKFWSFVVGAAPLDPELERFWSRMGYVVVQGYGLTETAPVVTLNHPFHARRGSVGKPIAGVEIRIADDGEILVRGENVTPGYLGGTPEGVFEGGWFHTGDIGFMDESGRVYVRGRKKEMIVTPEGLNVFPEDVERVLLALPGVRDAAVVGESRVHAVLVLAPGADPEAIVREANSRLEDHQRIRAYTLWTAGALPRTQGAQKLKRREILECIRRGALPTPSGNEGLASLLARYAPGRTIEPGTTIEELGISSLERVELLMALEKQFGVTVEESAYAQATTLADLERLVRQPAPAPPAPAIDFPSWNRSLAARLVRRINLPLWVLPLARVFARVRASGLEHLDAIEPPAIFALNHQSHLDIPALLLALPPKWRYRVAPAMSKEFFDAHFHPERHRLRDRVTNGLNYYLAALLFQAFPLPQREAGARDALRYAGELASEGLCIAIFPEGRITETGDIAPFQPGVALLASRLQLPVIPVRLEGLDRVLHRGSRMPVPGAVSVRFGKPLRVHGGDYAALARAVEQAVREL